MAQAAKPRRSATHDAVFFTDPDGSKLELVHIAGQPGDELR